MMIRILAFGAAFLATPALAAAPAAQFNLNCSGTMTTQSMAGKESEPYTTVYRIDLSGKKWCEGECKALFDVNEVQPAELTLQYKKVDTPSERSLISNRIDRETGAHTVTTTMATPGDRFSIIIIDWSGKCEPSAFTGFPKISTKF